MPAKIIVEGLYKIFGDNPEGALDLLREGLGKEEIFTRTGQTVGVENASFEIADGEVFVLMGLSGSGKSTLVRMFNRLIEPTAGSVHIDNQEITEMSEAQLIELRRRDVSMVFQSFALLPNRTVYENASFGLEVAGIPEEQRREATMDALDAVGLKAYADSLPQALSGGMQQRVGLARALAANPTIMLMDEAFSALDPLIRAEMQDQLLELQKERARTVVFVSHDLDEALKVGDRIAIMQEGRVIQVATPTEILRKPANDYVRAFFRGVDVSQVFTIGQLARRVAGTEVVGEDSSARDALDGLRNAHRYDAVVLDETSAVIGMVSDRSLNDAMRRDKTARCREAFLGGVRPVHKDTVLADGLKRLADSSEAIPVVDAKDRYVGLATKSAMLRALDRKSAGPPDPVGKPAPEGGSDLSGQGA